MVAPARPTFTRPLSDGTYQPSGSLNVLTAYQNGYPSYRVYGDGANDDRTAIQGLIDSVPAGSTLWFPAGTYRVVTTSSLTIPSGVGLYGVPGQTVFNVPTPASDQTLFYASGKSDITIQGFKVLTPHVGPDYDGANAERLTGVNMSGTMQNVTLKYLYFENAKFAMKLGANNTGVPESTGYLVEDITVRHSKTGIYIHDVHDSVFRRLDLEAHGLVGNDLDHTIYFNKNTDDNLFEDLTLRKAPGYSLQLYTGPSYRNTFRRVLCDAWESAYSIIVQGQYDLIFEHLTVLGRPGMDDYIRSYGTNNGVLFDGFNFTGALSSCEFWWVAGPLSNVTLRNGYYGGAEWYDNITPTNWNREPTATNPPAADNYDESLHQPELPRG